MSHSFFPVLFDSVPPVIVVADADMQMRAMLSHSLRQEGYEVVQVTDGIECLSVVRSHSPQLVLLDYELPITGGLECCLELGEVSDELAIVMMIQQEDEAWVEALFRAGADDYVTKPIHWAVLRQRVHLLLKMQRAIATALKRFQPF